MIEKWNGIQSKTISLIMSSNFLSQLLLCRASLHFTNKIIYRQLLEVDNDKTSIHDTIKLELTLMEWIFYCLMSSVLKRGLTLKLSSFFILCFICIPWYYWEKNGGKYCSRRRAQVHAWRLADDTSSSLLGDCVFSDQTYSL